MAAYPETMMWEGNVRCLSLAGQFSAAAKAGFDTLSITPLKYVQSLAEGLSTEDIRLMAADSGVRLSHIDPLCRWLPNWKPDNIDEGAMPLAFFGFSVEDFLSIARKLGAESLTAISVVPPGTTSIEHMTEAFAALCDRAAQDGLRCDLEFIPLDWAIPDLATVWKIVRDAGQPNGGIMFDLWHFVRSGSSLNLLKEIPGEKISSIQLTDASAQVPAHRSRMQDCLQDRRPTGEGDFPIADILGVLKETGGLRRIGPEIFSSKLDAMSGDDIAAICRDSLAKALGALGIVRPG